VSASGVRPETIEQLSTTARGIRQEILRMTYRTGSGRVGGSLSVTDLLTALLFHEMRIDPEHPDWPDRDRLVLSKGEAVPALYAALAQRGFHDPKALPTPRETGSPVHGPVDPRTVPGVEASTGAAGQGLGMAVGMALDARLAKRPNRVYAIVGDEECHAGLTWEALMAGGQYALDNLVVIVDRSAPSEGEAEGVSDLEPLGDKFRAFRYEALAIDGHDFTAIFGALARARTTKERPTAIIARTVLGKGVSFLERQAGWREKSPSRDEAERALAELGGSL
jgi:transketolase